MDIKLNTSDDMANKANSINYKLHHEQKRFNWWFKFTDKIKAIHLIWRF